MDQWQQDMPGHLWLASCWPTPCAAGQGRREPGRAPGSSRARRTCRSYGTTSCPSTPPRTSTPSMAIRTKPCGGSSVRLEIGGFNYPFLSQHDFCLAPLRRDPRFQDLMVRVKREWEAFRGVTMTLLSGARLGLVRNRWASSAKAEWARCTAPATRSSNSDVALKVLPADVAADPDRLARSGARPNCLPRSTIRTSARYTASAKRSPSPEPHRSW